MKSNSEIDEEENIPVEKMLITHSFYSTIQNLQRIKIKSSILFFVFCARINNDKIVKRNLCTYKK